MYVSQICGGSGTDAVAYAADNVTDDVLLMICDGCKMGMRPMFHRYATDMQQIPYTIYILWKCY